MATVVRRTFVSSPERDAYDTWSAIVDLLTVENVEAKDELESVGGVAASIISERAPAESPIIVTCSGPRTRIYCLYDEAAIDGSASNEDTLGFDPLNDGWAISLPCPDEDLDWVQPALANLTDRVTARDMSDGIDAEATSKSESGPLAINADKLLAP